MSKILEKTPRIGLFVTCLIDMLRPNIGFAAVKLLQDAGCQVEVPEGQTCCGQIAFNNGDFTNSRHIAKQVIESFEGFDYLVGASGSCISTIKTHYPKMLEDEPEWAAKAERLSSISFELISFLTDVLGIESLQSSFKGTVTYHDSCSGLRELGIKKQPRLLLNSIGGVSINEMKHSETCCGFGGTFCVKFPQISTRLATDKSECIMRSGADTMLGGDLGCLLNISGILTREDKPVQVYHIAEVLADMTDLAAIGAEEKKK